MPPLISDDPPGSRSAEIRSESLKGHEPASGLAFHETSVTESFHGVGRARCPASQTAELYVNTEILRRIRWIQWLTIAWMTVEVVLSFAAAWMARSPALVAFGGDSGIELLSAAVVLWRFRSRSMHERAEKQAARITTALLFMLAAYVIIASGAELLGHGKARRSPLGIGLLVAAAVIMPWLARQKRRLSATSSSGALRAEAAQSALCGYMASIALAGLVLNGIWGITWADPVAALALTPLILREGWESAKGKPSDCC